MPQQQHQEEEVMLYSGGAMYAVNFEYAGMVSNKTYIDAQNARLTPGDNNSLILKKIGGETLKYQGLLNYLPGGPGTTLPTSYKCIYADTINENLFEVWADSYKALNTLFRINGKVVAYSSEIPFSVDYPIQGHKNEGCAGGEVFLTDFNTPTHIYNIQDLIDNRLAATNKYVTLYKDELYRVTQRMPADHPVFVEISSTRPSNCIGIGSGGIKFGSYQYSIAYEDSTGNRTGWSEPTPLIPVPDGIGSGSLQYPFKKTYGGKANTNSSNGIHIRFRVTNILNYASIVLRRISFNSGSPLGNQGTDEIIYRLAILPQQLSVVDIFDLGEEGVALPIQDTQDFLSVIKRNKTVRYFDKRLHLMNVEYESKDLGGIELLPDAQSDEVFIPGMYNMGKAGHKDIWNQVYRKPFMHGERYGFGIRGVSGFGVSSWVTPMEGSSGAYSGNGTFDNFLMPNRRTKVNANVDASSFNANGLVIAADESSSFTADETFEVFDMNNAIAKSDMCTFKNILRLSTIPTVDENYKTKTAVNNNGCPLPWDQSNEYSSVPANRVDPGYRPFHSVEDLDTEDSGDDYLQTQTWDLGGSSIGFDTFKPTGFAPTYHSLGMKLGGVANFPDWVDAFSVDRTQAAGRILCQGLGMYSLNAGSDDAIAWSSRGSKDLNQMWFYFPDVETGITSLSDLLDNPSNYQAQFQSGLGFFTEIMNYKTRNLDSERNIDLISYARILFEDNLLNYGDDAANIGSNGNGYVDHQAWRNASNLTTAFSGGGATLFDITSVEAKRVTSQRGTFYKITFSSNIYSQGTPVTGGSAKDFDEIQSWHEPVYIVNIVRKNAEIDTATNQQRYYPTGSYIKMKGIIGKTNGENYQEFLLVDERIEDCKENTATGTEGVIYLKNDYDQEQKWIDITTKSGGDIAIILNDIHTNTGTYASYSGVYKVAGTLGVDGNDRFWYVYFDVSLSPNPIYNSLYKPASGYRITVKYDNQKPILVYGGDTLIGESTCAFIDAKGWRNKGDSDDEADENNEQFAMGRGWPYYKTEANERYYIPNRTYGTNKIQDTANCKLGHIRQMIFMFTSESKTNIPLAYNDSFPYKHFPLQQYVMRPQNWKDNESMAQNNMYEQYSIDYPEEATNGQPTGWDYGGFRYLQSMFNTNIDYCHSPENFIHFSKPKIGYTERTQFKTRDHWSSARETNEQDSPNLKSFPVLNYRDIDDNNGEIKKAFDAVTSKGNNLYAFTNSGVCLMLTNKFVARQISGEELGVIKPDGGEDSILEEIWLSKTQGINDEMWRSFSEYNNICWWTNFNSAWRMEDNQIKDIGRQYYHSRIYLGGISLLNSGYTDDMASVFNHYNGEYWLMFKKKHALLLNKQDYDADDLIVPGSNWVEVISATGCQIITPTTAGVDKWYVKNSAAGTVLIKNNAGATIYTLTGVGQIKLVRITGDTWTITTNTDVLTDQRVMFIYLDETYDKADKTGKWVGTFDYNFDQFVFQKNIGYGMRNGYTDQLDSGVTINGSNVTFKLIGFSTGGSNQVVPKEWWHIRVNNNNVQPTAIQFFETIAQLESNSPVAAMSVATNGALFLKNYSRGGWENHIPRKTAAPRNRLQGNSMIYLILYSGSASDFYLVNTLIEYKKLK